MEIFEENSLEEGLKKEEVLKAIEMLLDYYGYVNKQPAKIVVLLKLLSDYKKKFPDSKVTEIIADSGEAASPPSEGNNDN